LDRLADDHGHFSRFTENKGKNGESQSTAFTSLEMAGEETNKKKSQIALTANRTRGRSMATIEVTTTPLMRFVLIQTARK
jgi:hypothetical protein